MDSRLVDEIRDDATREAVIELWRSARDAVREINASVEAIAATQADLERRLGVLEAAVSRFRGPAG
jgi:hypothetical protein